MKIRGCSDGLGSVFEEMYYRIRVGHRVIISNQVLGRKGIQSDLNIDKNEDKCKP